VILYNGEIECRLLEYELYAGSLKKQAAKDIGPEETDNNLIFNFLSIIVMVRK